MPDPHEPPPHLFQPSTSPRPAPPPPIFTSPTLGTCSVVWQTAVKQVAVPWPELPWNYAGLAPIEDDGWQPNDDYSLDHVDLDDDGDVSGECDHDDDLGPVLMGPFPMLDLTNVPRSFAAA